MGRFVMNGLRIVALGLVGFAALLAWVGSRVGSRPSPPPTPAEALAARLNEAGWENAQPALPAQPEPPAGREPDAAPEPIPAAPPKPPRARSPKEIADGRADHALMVGRRVAKDEVPKFLKSPATADFPYLETEVRIMGEGDLAVYNVRGAVDSQNGFGALVRTPWSCTLVWHRNDFHPRGLSLDGKIVRQWEDPRSSADLSRATPTDE